MVDLKMEWIEATKDQSQDKIAEFANLLIFGYLCSLRGEEIVKVDVLGFLKYLILDLSTRVSSPDGSFARKIEGRDG
jgi:hypothetical protein